MIVNWPRVKVSELCEIIVDCVNKTAPAVEYETPFKMIRTSNIKNGVVNLSGCHNVTQDTYEKWTRRATVDKGDILLTREAPMGEVGLVNFQGTVFLGQRIMQYRVNPRKLDSNYLLYAFLSPDLQYQFRRHNNTGSTVSHIKVPDCSKFEISLPTLTEQKKVSKVLRDLDKKIALNNKINAELEAMATLIYDYWFVQFDFPDANGKPYKTSGGKMVYSEALKREIPQGWEVKKLSAITYLIQRGVSPKYVEENGISVINQKCIRNQKISFGPCRRHGGSMKENDDRLLILNDVLVNSTGVGTLGRVAFVKRVEEERTTVDSHVTIVRADPHLIDTTLLAWQMLRLQPTIEKLAEGSTGQVELNKSYLEDLDIVIPIADIQGKFRDYARAIETKLSNSEVESELLIKLRDWLLPMLMNGQVTVKDA